MARLYDAYFVIAACCTLAPLLNACSNGDDGTATPTIDGSGPSSALIQGSDGNCYGTTATGGQLNEGTVYRITPEGDQTVLYSFSGGAADGATPRGALVQGSDGNLYGATGGGGIGECPAPEPVGYSGPPAACGTVFKLTPRGAEEIPHFFSGTTDGGAPTGGLVHGGDGSFYGTTDADGLTGDCCGPVFKITLAAGEMALYSFRDGAIDGSIPSSLVQGTDGDFYGTTLIGGSSADGTVFPQRGRRPCFTHSVAAMMPAPKRALDSG